MKHIFFDLDGTLTNPKEGITACIRHALVALQEPIPTDRELEQWIGPPLSDSFAAVLGCPDRTAQAVALYRDRFATVGLFENELYPGIPELLATLVAQQYTLWVSTSKPQIFARQIIQHFQLADFFAGVYGSELDGTRAHKADLLSHLLTAEGIQPQAAMMVGDRAYDIVGARQNRMAAIGVTWGFGTETELQTAGAIAVCHQPDQLSSLLLTAFAAKTQEPNCQS